MKSASATEGMDIFFTLFYVNVNSDAVLDSLSTFMALEVRRGSTSAGRKARERQSPQVDREQHLAGMTYGVCPTE